MAKPNPPSDRGGATEALAGAGVLSALDVHFARLLARLTGDRSAALALAAALASRAVRAGHVCLRLDDPGAVVPDDVPFEAPEPGAWARALSGSPAVARPGELRPLVLDSRGRLYLYRYWRYERDLAAWVRGRALAPALAVDRGAARAALDRLFPHREGETDFQKVAAAVALLRPLAILSGGPGTGKTFTVVRILAALLSMPGGERLRIALAAPTGKAAARLQEAVRAAKAGPGPVAALGAAEAIPETAFTLHRLLGAVPGSSAFRHGPDNPLPHDVVVVDEVSMVDLALMAKLVRALRPGARLVLVGDRDQLASVEAGSVLGDLCDTGRDHGVPRDMVPSLEELTGCDLSPEARDEPPLARSLVVLRRNYRFPEDSAIGRVTRAVNRGRGTEALRLLREAAGDEVSWRDLAGPRALIQALAPAVARGLVPVLELLEQGDPEGAYARLQEFRILCALREGPFGAGSVNRAVRQALAERGLARAEGEWYPGRPVLVTRNDYTLRLFNGDVGLAFQGRDGALRVLFPSPDGGFREVPPVRIGACETVYAMTVHKAQGSEFDRVILVLGDGPSRVLTRELVYTGITRARSRVEVWGSEQAFLWAVGRRAERSSGLRDALWGGAPGP